MEGIHIFLIILGVIIIIYLFNRIKDYLHERSLAHDFVYAPIEKFIYPNFVTKLNYSSDKNIFLDKYNQFMVMCKELEFKRKLLETLDEKIKVSRKWNFDKTSELEKIKRFEMQKVDILNRNISNYKYINNKSKIEISLEDKMKNIINEITDEKLSLFLKKQLIGYNTDNGFVIFVDDLICVIQKNYLLEGIYFYDELKVENKIKLEEVQNPNNDDEIISTTYLHPRKNGEKDLRYSFNPKIYKVKKYYLNFNLQPKFVFVLNSSYKFEKFSLFFSEVNKKIYKMKVQQSNIKAQKSSEILSDSNLTKEIDKEKNNNNDKKNNTILEQEKNIISQKSINTVDVDEKGQLFYDFNISTKVDINPVEDKYVEEKEEYVSVEIKEDIIAKTDDKSVITNVVEDEKDYPSTEIKEDIIAKTDDELVTTNIIGEKVNSNSIDNTNIIHSDIENELEEMYIYSKKYGYGKVLERISDLTLNVEFGINKLVVLLDVNKDIYRIISKKEYEGFISNITNQSSNSTNTQAEKNTILLFVKSINVIPSDNHFVIHEKFGLGKFIKIEGNCVEIDFIDALENKKINVNFPVKIISIKDAQKYIFEKYLKNKYILINDKVGVINAYDECLKVDVANKIIDVEVEFKEDFSELILPYDLTDEKTYLQYKNKENEEKQNLMSKLIGMKVAHDLYKTGTIIDVKETYYVINFVDYGIKNISLNHKGLVISANETHEEKIIIGDCLNFENEGILQVLQIEDKRVLMNSFYGKIFISKERVYEAYSNGLKVELNNCNYKVGDYFYSPKNGYIKLLTLYNGYVDLYRYYDGEILSTTIEKVKLLSKVNNDNEIQNVKSLKINDLVLKENVYYIITKIDKNKVTVFDPLKSIQITTDLSNINIVNKNDKIDYIVKNILAIPKNYLFKIIFNDDYYFYKDIKDEISNIENKTKRRLMYDYSYIEKNLVKVNNVNGIWLNNAFESFEKYLLSKIIEQEAIYYNNDFESQHYDYILNKFTNSKLLLKVSDSKYITILKLGDLEITNELMTSFENVLKLHIQKEHFVVLEKVKAIFDGPIAKIFYFDDVALMDFILSFTDFKKYKIGNRIAITIKSDLTKNQKFELFVTEIIKSKNMFSMDIYDLMYILNDDYLFDFNIDNLITEVNDFEKIFYSEEIEKIYLKKKYYYDEVYKNGE